jgi:hypothetical protein
LGANVVVVVVVIMDALGGAGSADSSDCSETSEEDSQGGGGGGTLSLFDDFWLCFLGAALSLWLDSVFLQGGVPHLCFFVMVCEIEIDVGGMPPLFLGAGGGGGGGGGAAAFDDDDDFLELLAWLPPLLFGLELEEAFVLEEAGGGGAGLEEAPEAWLAGLNEEGEAASGLGGPPIWLAPLTWGTPRTPDTVGAGPDEPEEWWGGGGAWCDPEEPLWWPWCFLPFCGSFSITVATCLVTVFATSSIPLSATARASASISAKTASGTSASINELLAVA